MNEKCAWCGQNKEVYAWKEGEYEEGMEHYDKTFVAQGKEPLREGDVVGYPICKECYAEITGQEEVAEVAKEEVEN